MTIYLYVGLWIDRNVRRPCAYLAVASMVLLVAALAGLDPAWRFCAATALISFPPIVLMFLCMWAHNRVSRRRAARREREKKD